MYKLESCYRNLINTTLYYCTILFSQLGLQMNMEKLSCKPIFSLSGCNCKKNKYYAVTYYISILKRIHFVSLNKSQRNYATQFTNIKMST